MTKKWMAISLLLFIVACLLGWWLHNSIDRYNANNDLNNLQPSRDMMQKLAREQILPQSPEEASYIPGEFAVIPDNNVFSESRSRAEEATEDTAQIDARPLSQKPILVGISITDSEKTVLLVDPKGSSQAKGRRAEIKRIGDVYQGHTITDIAPDYIVLESGSQKEIIPLHEGSKETAGGRTPILSTRIVSFGGGSASGGQPVAGASKSVAARITESPVPVAKAASKSQATATATAIAAPASQSRPKSAARTQQPQRTQSQVSPNTGSNAPKTRVVRTPFGDIVRPVRD